MGFSYTYEAGRTMGGIERACAASRPDGETSSNVFFTNGRRYFYEITRRDQDDGGLRGEIHLTWTDEQGQEWCRRVGDFRIDGRGRVVRGPALFRRATPIRAGESRGRWG